MVASIRRCGRNDFEYEKKLTNNKVSISKSEQTVQRLTVTLLLPTYNEIDGLKSIFPLIDQSLFDDILVVDGGSSDGTLDYAFAQGLRVMTQLRKGLGPAVFDEISTIETDCVVEFSMDGNCMIEQLEPLVNKLRGDAISWSFPAICRQPSLMTIPW